MVSFSLPDHFGAPAGDTAVGSAAEAIREVVNKSAKVGMASAAVATLGALPFLFAEVVPCLVREFGVRGAGD